MSEGEGEGKRSRSQIERNKIQSLCWNYFSPITKHEFQTSGSIAYKLSDGVYTMWRCMVSAYNQCLAGHSLPCASTLLQP